MIRTDKHGRRRLGRALLILGAVAALSGCTSRLASSGGVRATEKEYTRGQLMVVAATERNRYQNIYTSQLWEVRAEDGGETFEDQLKGQMEQFLVELAVMNAMAQEKGVELTSQEKDSIKALSSEYYDSLSEGDRAYMGASEAEIEDLYSQYYLADKLVTELTSGENLEVSDAEAKVIQVQRIRLSDRETADQALEEAQGERADFGAIAAKYSEDSQTEVTLEWNDDLNAVDQAAFALEQDGISQVTEYEGSFYIQKCTNAYDEEATAARKTLLAQEKKTRAFLAIYKPYAREHPVKLKEGVWDQIGFEGGEDCTSDGFFQMYHSYFSR